MAYKTSFWRERKFREDVQTGEAVLFLKGRESRVVQMPFDFIMIAFSHSSNITKGLREGKGVYGALMNCMDAWTQKFVKMYALKNE